LLNGCRGFLHADAYAGFNDLYRADPLTGEARLVEVACWTHACRKLYDVHVATKSPAAEELLERIGELFAVEADKRSRRIVRYACPCSLVPADAVDPKRMPLPCDQAGGEMGELDDGDRMTPCVGQHQ
jgi:hypothetical protein